MSNVIYELECDSCGVGYDVSFSGKNAQEKPTFCPCCGEAVDLEDLDEEDGLGELYFDEENDLLDDND
jgi:hypothetical protein